MMKYIKGESRLNPSAAIMIARALEVYQRGITIESQRQDHGEADEESISKGNHD